MTVDESIGSIVRQAIQEATALVDHSAPVALSTDRWNGWPQLARPDDALTGARKPKSFKSTPDIYRPA
jgi:hypothetical protein